MWTNESIALLACTARAATRGLVSKWSRQVRLTRVQYEHRQEFCRLRFAGIGADGVPVAGHLRETLPGRVGRHRAVVDLTADRPLQHGCVDEGGLRMGVARRVAARAVLDENALDTLARDVRQLVLIHEGHLGALLLGCVRVDAAQWQGCDKQ